MIWATIRFQKKVENEWLFFFQILKKMSKIKLTLNKINVIVVTNIKVAQNKLIGGSHDKNIGGSIRTH